MRELQNKNRDFKGIWIPARVWLDTELTVMEKIIFVEIDSLDGEKGCYANNQHFADFCDISKGRASQIINKLKEKGYISVNIERDENGQVVRRTMRSLLSYDIRPLSSKTIEGVSSKTIDPPLVNDQYKNTSFKNTISKLSPTEVEPEEEEENLKKKDLDKIIAKWNDNTKGKIRPIRAINRNTNRYKQLNARYKESSLAEVLEGIENISKSKFLQGYNDRGWVIDFDWYIKPSNFIKVLEGNFTDTKPAKAKVKRDFTFTGEGY